MFQSLSITSIILPFLLIFHLPTAFAGRWGGEGGEEPHGDPKLPTDPNPPQIAPQGYAGQDSGVNDQGDVMFSNPGMLLFSILSQPLF